MPAVARLAGKRVHNSESPLSSETVSNFERGAMGARSPLDRD
jgi:hypothetical protein